MERARESGEDWCHVFLYSLTVPKQLDTRSQHSFPGKHSNLLISKRFVKDSQS